MQISISLNGAIASSFIGFELFSLCILFSLSIQQELQHVAIQRMIETTIEPAENGNIKH
jgi:hypothetical protein